MATSDTGTNQKLQERMKEARASADKENQDNHQSLTQAKGRAQVTATTAMSIVSVVLLKNVLDQGPDGNKYYLVRLVLISVSLALQILAGLMGLAIEQSLGYFSKHGSNFCEDMGEYCCPWRCVKNTLLDTDSTQKKEIQPLYSTRDTHSKKLEDEETPGEKLNTSWRNMQSTTLVADASEDPLCECCPFVVTNKIYAQHEITAIEKFNKWQINSIDNELQDIRADEELEYQTRVVEESKKKLAKLTELLTKPGADSDEINSQIAELESELATALKRKESYENTVKKAKIIREQGTMLKEYADAITKNRVLRQASFWQQILNYIFYTIFIMNAFITGFGLNESPTAVVVAVAGSDSTGLPQS